jgi:ribosomal protein L30/L7E
LKLFIGWNFLREGRHASKWTVEILRLRKMHAKLLCKENDKAR